MIPLSEILTAVAAGTSVVALAIGATLFITSDSSSTSTVAYQEQAVEASHRFGIGDAYFPCRDRIRSDVELPVRNVNVDSHSSRYDTLRNDNVVYIDLQLPGNTLADTEGAKIVCRVSAASNEITAFQLRRS